jgi:hypothetical protein
VFQGGILPLAYEFCARMVFPVGAGTAGGILQVFYLYFCCVEACDELIRLGDFL